MGSPKHLWSGEWEDESAAAAARRRAAARPSTEDVDPIATAARPSPPRGEGRPASGRRRSARAELRRWTAALSARPWAAAAAVVLVVALAAGAAAALLGGGHATPRSEAAVTLPQTAPSTPTPGGGPTSPGGAQSSPGLIPNTSGASAAQGPGWLGVELQASAGAVVIAGIVAGGPADAGNLRPGDVVLAVDGRSVTTPQQVVSLVSALSPGQTASVRLRRGSQTLVRQVTVGQRPSGYLSP